jgi:hypothetical protein
MKAYCMIREAPWYRREAFASGLKAAGYEVSLGNAERAKPGDVLVIWNRYAGYHAMAVQFEREGGTVIVAENGYISAGGSSPKFDVHPHGPKPTDYYAISKHGHNGSGKWPVGGGERWAALGIELKPWRTDGDYILVCGQRGIGSPTMASPADWHVGAAERIRKATKRPVRIRLHPGNNAPKVPLEHDLAGASACVIWSSGSGVKSLVAGIPTYYDAPHWICQGGAMRLRDAGDFETPLRDDAARLAALERMAWAQWTVTEIQSGEPFRKLLA